MATGYTHCIEDGTVTEFKDFAMRCARAFGALIEMRDSSLDAPIPDQFEPSDFYLTQTGHAKARLSIIENMTDAECERMARRECDAAASGAAERVVRDAEILERYKAMRAKVEAWSPPSPDHEGMKKFMLSQIDESMRWRGEPTKTSKPPKPLSAAEWRVREIATHRERIADCEKNYAEEVARVAQRNEWVRLLRESLEDKPQAAVTQ
jgi:hypothetical protein